MPFSVAARTGSRCSATPYFGDATFGLPAFVSYFDKRAVAFEARLTTTVFFYVVFKNVFFYVVFKNKV
jgi:hypothetical protein